MLTAEVAENAEKGAQGREAGGWVGRRGCGDLGELSGRHWRVAQGETLCSFV